MNHTVKAGQGMHQRRYLATMTGVATSAVVVAALVGCSDLTGRNQLPSGTPDPSSFNTLQGALGMRNAAIYDFESALRQYVVASGLLTDELTDASTGASQANVLAGKVIDALDERILPEDQTPNGQPSYNALQKARGEINQALGALATYGTAAPSAVRGELYALEGYTELLLADLFCSGVPLSTLDFQGDYTYHASSTTQEVYAEAIAKFDTAIALSTDSARILNFALIGKGRALLSMDSIAAAAQVVSTIPNGFAYSLAVQWKGGSVGTTNAINAIATVATNEGQTGLLYRTDPRTATVVGGTSVLTHFSLFFPAKYGAALSGSGYAPFALASWIEVQLIQAEAALRTQQYNTWLTILNTLRQTATVPGQTGTLTPLTDPGASSQDSARVAVLFRERAYWLFLDGHRQGDLRRLLRQYGWSQDAAYPIGAYLAPGLGQYGTDVTAPIPVGERPNPLFHGCFDRNA